MFGLKVFISGIIALLLLSIFCLFYYNPGIHVNSPNDATDYVWGADTLYSRGTEGFAFGKTDIRGYNNVVSENFKDK
jgi:hypothetical protein